MPEDLDDVFVGKDVILTNKLWHMLGARAPYERVLEIIEQPFVDLFAEVLHRLRRDACRARTHHKKSHVRAQAQGCVCAYVRGRHAMATKIRERERERVCVCARARACLLMCVRL